MWSNRFLCTHMKGLENAYFNYSLYMLMKGARGKLDILYFHTIEKINFEISYKI